MASTFLIRVGSRSAVTTESRQVVGASIESLRVGLPPGLSIALNPYVDLTSARGRVRCARSPPEEQPTHRSGSHTALAGIVQKAHKAGVEFIPEDGRYRCGMKKKRKHRGLSVQTAVRNPIYGVAAVALHLLGTRPSTSGRSHLRPLPHLGRST